MANTTNYNWETPDDTDLVKDGAAAIRTLGSSVDTTTKALNPSTTLGDIEYRSATANTNTRLPIGTTGQILSVVAGVPSWVANDVGDITGVAAGTGISGGGTSGTVTITNSMATAIDAKGDLVVGTGADTFSRLAVGTNTYVLTADSAEATGLKWAAPAAGGGKVLQVVSAKTQTSKTSATSTWVDTNLTATITPTLATSKVLVMVHQGGCAKTGTSDINIKLLRGATDIDDFAYAIARNATSGDNYVGSASTVILDAPATTSATTYKTQMRTFNGATAEVQNNGSTSTITLLEIGV